MNSFGQNRSENREYVSIDHSYERITLKKDSFNYIYNVGLSKTDVDGTIKYRNDTLIFNSEYQADNFEIVEKFNPNLKKNEFEIIIIDTIVRNQIDLFATKRFNRKEKTRLNPYEEKFDSITLKSTTKYILNEQKFPKRKGAIVKIWRKNIHVHLEFKDEKSNSISIEFLKYPFWLDYIFFKEVEAIETDKGLIFLGKDNNLIEADFTIENRVKKKKVDKELKIYRPRKNE